MKRTQILYLLSSTLIGALITVGYFAFSRSDIKQGSLNSLLSSGSENINNKETAKSTPPIPTYCEYNFKRLIY